MPPRRLIVLVLAASLASPPAGGQEEGAPPPAPDLRPPAAAYTVLDGVRIPAPLDGLSGDAERGAALFADLETGGCVACHAAPGFARVEAAPRILRDRLPELAPPLPEPATPGPEPEALAAEAGNDSDSPLAPVAVALLPPPRPAQEPEAPAAAEEEPAAEAPARPPLLPLPPAPSLEGVAERLTAGQLRLWVVNPRVADAEARMPAYHDVSPALARRNPELRQPWLSPQQVEDVVAYLLTLAPAPEPEAEE